MIHSRASFLPLLLAYILSISLVSVEAVDLLGSLLGSARKNPRIASARASFQGKGIEAVFQFVANPSGIGAHVTIFVTGLTEQVPNAYHIHMFKVDSTGNCSSTGPHFNPTKAVAGSCNPQKPQLCESGDLAGKHGKILTPSDEGEYSTSYDDASLQLTQSATGILYRSVVIHGEGVTRLACGTIIPDFRSGSRLEVSKVMKFRSSILGGFFLTAFLLDMKPSFLFLCLKSSITQIYENHLNRVVIKVFLIYIYIYVFQNLHLACK